eukprot:m.3699 g.3699  ORF g.3699 m.3699 type:complete len:86 (+) comp4281_c0_seq1:61-318(+)
MGVIDHAIVLDSRSICSVCCLQHSSTYIFDFHSDFYHRVGKHELTPLHWIVNTTHSELTFDLYVYDFQVQSKQPSIPLQTSFSVL